jgi:hypothetical protein
MSMPYEVSDSDKEEYLRETDERQRRTGVPPFNNGLEALKAFRDLFGSDEEMIEFAELLQRMREEERARYRD